MQIARAECVAVSMNLSKGHREVTVRFHGLYVKQTKGVGSRKNEGEKVRVRERWEEWERKRIADLEGRRNQEGETEREREGDRGSLRSSIGRFKDDHALSAIPPSELTNPPPPLPSDRWERYAVRKPLGNNP